MLEASLRGFVELQTGGSVASAQPLGAGASRRSWLLDVTHGGVRERLVLRQDAPDSVLCGTELDLAREGVVYRALQGRGVRIPRLRASRRDALLLEHVPGSSDFGSVLDA